MFEDFSDKEFASWLAGFFDGEGCIYFPRHAKNAVDITIANTYAPVISGIRNRLKMGLIDEVTFESHPHWKVKYALRIRNFEQCGLFLRLVRPYLIIKATKADEAIVRIEKFEKRLADLKKRNERIIALYKSGVSFNKIGPQVGITRQMVSLICKGYELSKHQVRADLNKQRAYCLPGMKKKVKVRTSSISLP